MSMNTVRSPVFSDHFPNKAAFLNKNAGSRDAINAIAENITKSGSLSDHEKSAGFSTRSLDTDSSTFLTSYNSRIMSDHLCAQVRSKIVPACHGRIENLLITVPSYPDQTGQRFIDARHERHYLSLIAALGENRKYTVVCHPTVKAQVEQWFLGISGVIADMVLSPRFNYSIWAQDAYVGLRDRFGNSILSEGVLFPRADDMSVADDVAAQTSTAVLQSYLYFQGGNVLGGPELTIIGQDYIWRNETRAHLANRNQVVEHFSRIFGTEILVLGADYSSKYQWYADGVLSGYGNQPIFHIDMYVTPTGVIGPTGKEIIMLGRPSKAHEITGRWAEVDNYDDARYDELFEDAERQLEQHYEVRHLPLMLTKGNLNQPISSKYYNLSFNNVVLEKQNSSSIDKGTVVMTTYSQDSDYFGTDRQLRVDLEQAAEDIWKDIGFDVKLMDGMEDLAYGDGSIHCITKTLRRGAFNPPA